ncbi:MAG: hypothetical protein Q9219_004584 [cf. Caloplaca sp. 3 TL-2023]
MCCWPFVGVVLEDPPKKAKKEYKLVESKTPAIKMCCWPVVDVVLEDPPKKKEYKLVSDQLNVVGPVQPVLPAPTYQPQYPMYYAGQPQLEPTKIWYGSTKAEVDAQNAALAQTVGAFKPMEFVPANPTPGQQFYCRELDGTYTLRTVTDIETSCQPGSWHRASSGYPYFIRRAA